jgi:hypothetical protein
MCLCRRQQVLLVVIALASMLSGLTSASAAIVVKTYVASGEDFINPERGFHVTASLVDGGGWGRTIDFTSVRQQGHSLVRAHIRMDAFRRQDLSPLLLQQMREGLAGVRKAGVKALLVFSYNFPELNEAAEDAPLAQVLRHLQQLKPVLNEYQDVIAALETGFIGKWGEWHSSSNALDTPANKKTILNAILAALPKSRMMQIRTPEDMMASFPTPLTAAGAFSGGNQSRTAFANMCFLVNESDAGTWVDSAAGSAQQKRDYMKKVTPYMVVGGETCQVEALAGQRSDCSTSLRELAQYHWSYLNSEFYEPTLTRWKQQGCYSEISRRLGYRFRLLDARIPDTATAGGAFNLSFRIANSGFASAYNARAVELVLRHRVTKQEVRTRLASDPRRWFAGTTNTVNASWTLPANLQAGAYDLLLNLPDPAAPLTRRADYSIRLANQGLWEPTTGYNSLQAIVRIGASIAAAEKIIDNAAAGTQDIAGGRGFTGEWCLSSAPNSYGGNSLYSCGGGADTYRWTPAIAAAGSYDVYIWWSTHPNRSASVPIVVKHAAGMSTKQFNQKTGGGQWVLHGRYVFNAATAGYVEVNDGNGQAAADAVRLVRVP